MTTVTDQKNMFYRAGTIAALLAMNEQIRKIDPTEAWHPDNIRDASNSELDSLRDSISATLVSIQR